jgi:hypothetical protein
MGLVKDREKWLKFLEEVDEPAVSPLASSPEFFHGEAVAPVEKTTALVLTFRAVPRASDDELASMTSHLLCRLNWREEELGGEGLEFDVNGSVFGPDRVVLRLFPSKREGAAQRVAALVDELNSEGRRVADRERPGADDGIGAKIARNLKSALPEIAMKHFETAAVA